MRRQGARDLALIIAGVPRCLRHLAKLFEFVIDVRLVGTERQIKAVAAAVGAVAFADVNGHHVARSLADAPVVARDIDDIRLRAIGVGVAFALAGHVGSVDRQIECAGAGRRIGRSGAVHDQTVIVGMTGNPHLTAPQCKEAYDRQTFYSAAHRH